MDLISLQKYVSLNQNTDFVRAYHRGKSYAEPALVVYVLKNRAGVCRVGITVSKKVGNAVERNRSRRIIKAAFRELAGECACSGLDIVFVARSKTKHMKSTTLVPAMRRLLVRAGVIEA